VVHTEIGKFKKYEEKFLGFFALYVMNLVFGALAIGFGVQHMIISVLGLAGGAGNS
jgi:hypothetical protein